MFSITQNLEPIIRRILLSHHVSTKHLTSSVYAWFSWRTEAYSSRRCSTVHGTSFVVAKTTEILSKPTPVAYDCSGISFTRKAQVPVITNNRVFVESTTLEEFEKFIFDPSRSMDELLAVDVRPLSSIARLTCLEAVLNLSRDTQLRMSIDASSVNTREQLTKDNNWTQNYLNREHRAYWSDWDIGINPIISAGSEPEWFFSPQFELLVLTTAACANQLSTSSLLNLTGHLRHLWRYYDPLVYASVIRLLTSQINELSLRDILRLGSFTRHFPKPDTVTDITESVGADLSDASKSGSSQMLYQEVHLLRTALCLRALAKLTDVEPLDAVTLFRFTHELYPFLTANERTQLMNKAYYCLTINRRQQNLYALVFACSRMSLMNTYQRDIVITCFKQIHRKLGLSNWFPAVDQINWLGAITAALANLNVGAPHVVETHSEDAIGLFVCPPVMPHAATPMGFASDKQHIGVNLAKFCSSRWVLDIFTDLTGYLLKRPLDLVDKSLTYLLEIVYSLALLGYRADSILEQAYALRAKPPDTSDTIPPYLPLIEMLVGPTSSFTIDAVDLRHVNWLPRVDWQFYYRLAKEVSNQTTPEGCGSDKQLADYVNSKYIQVSEVADKLSKRVNTRMGFEILTFRRLQLKNENHSYFADVLFKRDSFQSKGYTKLLLCFVGCQRDFLVNRPLQTLMNTYEHNLSNIPVMTFNHSWWKDLGTSGQQNESDEFLRRVVLAMKTSSGVKSTEFELWSVDNVRQTN